MSMPVRNRLTLKEAALIIVERLGFAKDEPPEDAAWPILREALYRGVLTASGQVLLMSGETQPEIMRPAEKWHEVAADLPDHPDHLLPLEKALWRLPRPATTMEVAKTLDIAAVGPVSRDWWHATVAPEILLGNDMYISREKGPNRELLRFVLVEQVEIDRVWPAYEPNDTPTTGAPGRPSSMFLIEEEAKRRRLTRTTHQTLSMEARELAKWLRITHPKMPPTAPGTIENNIRGEHKQYWATPRN